MKILFTGDLFTGGDLVSTEINKIIHSKVYHSADIRVANLENPLSNSLVFSNKSILFSPPDVGSRVLKSLDIDICGLANNHIHDKGLEGIGETINTLKANNIRYFGAGETIVESKKAVKLTNDLYVLGYCQFDSPTLNKIQLASSTEPGVNPLEIDNIRDDLMLMPPGGRAILYFHWGQEHLWLTGEKNLVLAKKLLKDERVVGIIGMHPHRPQGFLKYKSKKCYFCLGNFLFPNFFIAPPSRISYEEIIGEHDTTFRYHPVTKITRKKWKFVNRLSIGVTYNTKTNEFTETYFLQDKEKAIVKEINGVLKFGVKLWIEFINLFYKLPITIYNPLQMIHRKIHVLQWNLGIVVFKIKQDGFVTTFNKIRRHFL